MFVSLIVPTYNRVKMLRKTLQACCNQSYLSYEVIVIDDASNDDTQVMIQLEFPSVIYLRQAKNKGPAAARNRGIDIAKGEIIAFTDDDCVPPHDFLFRLVDGYRRYPQVVGVGGYQEPPNEVIRANVFARLESLITHKIYHVGDKEVIGGYKCPAGGTNSMSYRKDVLNKIGKFDESFLFAAGEDAYLKWKLSQCNYLFLFISLKIVHYQSYTFKGFIHQQVRRGMGSAHFEYLITGKILSLSRLVIRILKRCLLIFLNIANFGLNTGLVKTLGDLVDVYGQLKYKLATKEIKK